MPTSSRPRAEVLCELSVQPIEGDKHPLHMVAESSTFQYLFGKGEESTGVISIETNSSQAGYVERCLYAVVNKTMEEESEAASYPDLRLFCSDEFLRHYNLDDNDYISVRPVQLFPLEKLVISVTSDEAMKWARGKFFGTGLLLSVCQQPVLVRQDDTLLVPYNVLFSHEDVFDMTIFSDMKVIACEPLMQGRLTVNTEIIIVNHMGRTDETCQRLYHSKTNASDHQEVDEEIYQPFILSDFAVGATQVHVSQGGAEEPDAPSSSGKSLLGSVNFDKDYVKPTTALSSLSPCIVNSVSEMWSLFEAHSPEDIFSVVGLSAKTMEQLGLFSGSLADIDVALEKPVQSRLDSKKDQGKDRHILSKLKSIRTVTVFVAQGKSVQDGVAYLTPGLYFNICRKAPQTSSTRLVIKKSPLSEETSFLGNGEELSTSWSWRGSVPYAGEVHLSVVNSPRYAVSVNTNNILKEYFTVPRMLKKGDVVAIHSKHADFCGAEIADGNMCPNPVIYFKVTTIHPSLPSIYSYMVDVDHSVLFQDGSVNSYIPGTMPMMLNDDRSVLPPPGMSAQHSKLLETIKPHFHHRRKEDDPVPSVLLTGQTGCGKGRLTKSVAASLHLHYFQMNAHELCGDTSASTEARVKAMMSRATTYAPCILHLRNIDVFGKAADGNTEEPRTASAFHEIVRHQLTEHNKWPMVIIASTSRVKHVNMDLYEGFLHEQTIEVPTEVQRQGMLSEILRPMSTMGNINIPHIAQRTAGFVLGDVYTLISQAHRHAYKRIVKYGIGNRQTNLTFQEEEDLISAGIVVTDKDFEAALDNLQSAHSDSIGAPKIPQVSWDDVGGLVSVKTEILNTIQLPLQHPELLAAGLRRSGVLLYGPPGTGKTLLAKAVATECSLNFLSVKGPELINMYVGQSEENVREVFQRARTAAPCVIFFDELDSLAPNRGRSGDSGGVMDRVVSQLLAELDGMNKSADVFIIGATNRPDLLDPALLRPGRFDKLLYLGVSEDRASQLNILTALTRKFVLVPGVSLERVVEQCPLNMTGADFYALCSDAMLNALKRKIALLEQGTRIIYDRNFLMQCRNSPLAKSPPSNMAKIPGVMSPGTVQDNGHIEAIDENRPAGTRIIYDRNFLMQCRNSPLAKSPPSNMAKIPGVMSPGTVQDNGHIEAIDENRPAGTRIIYDRNFLMQCCNSPLAKSPPSNMAKTPGVMSPGTVQDNGHIEAIDENRPAGIEVDQSQVEVEEDDFRDALDTLVPSVSMAELARYQSLQTMFGDQKANKKGY